MSKRLSKEEQRYQLGKPYDFRKLEAAIHTLNQEYTKILAENEELRADVKKYEKIFEGQTNA